MLQGGHGGCVEYVDTKEEETTLIAVTLKHLDLQRQAVSVAVGWAGGGLALK